MYNVLTLLMTLVSRTKGSNLAGCKGGDSGLGNTFGWRRMEVVGSIGSLVFLFSLCFATFIEALQTIFHNEHLDTMHHADWIMIALGGQVSAMSCRIHLMILDQMLYEHYKWGAWGPSQLK